MQRPILDRASISRQPKAASSCQTSLVTYYRLNGNNGVNTSNDGGGVNVSNVGCNLKQVFC